jgi:hypothetical protein
LLDIIELFLAGRGKMLDMIELDLVGCSKLLDVIGCFPTKKMLDVAGVFFMEKQRTADSQFGCWRLLCACIVCFVSAVVSTLLAFGLITHANNEGVC